MQTKLFVFDARYDRGIPFFGYFFFARVTGSLKPKSSEIGIFFFHDDSSCVPRPSWDFFIRWRGFYFFRSKSVFGRRGLKRPKLRGSIRKKKGCTSIVERVFFFRVR